MSGKKRVGTLDIKGVQPKSPEIKSFSQELVRSTYPSNLSQVNATCVSGRCRWRGPSGGPAACWSCWGGGS